MKKLNWIVSLGVMGLATATLAAEDHGPGPRLEKLDTDGDGAINFEEFQSMGAPMLARLDKDQDGLLSLQEFTERRPRQARNDGDDARQVNEQRREQMHQRMLEQATLRFEEMDLDGDKFLSMDEFQQANFLAMDRDGNGLLNADELRPPRRGGPRGHNGEPGPQGGRGEHGRGQSEHR